MLLGFGEYTLSYITLIEKDRVVVDFIKDLTAEQATGLGEMFFAVVSESPEISQSMAIISTSDSFVIAPVEALGENFRILYRSERVVLLPDGRLFADGAPFRGGFNMARLRRGKWQSSTNRKDQRLFLSLFELKGS